MVNLVVNLNFFSSVYFVMPRFYLYSFHYINNNIIILYNNIKKPPYIIKVDFCLLLKKVMRLSPGPLLRYHDACLDNVAKFTNAKIILFSNQLTKKAHTDV